MYQNQLLAARILDATLSGHNLTDVMSSEAAHITGDRRAQLLDLTHGSLRRYGRLRVKLDHLLERPLTDPVVDRLLIVALSQLEATRAAPYAIVDHAVRAAGEQPEPEGAGPAGRASSVPGKRARQSAQARARSSASIRAA